jgi:glutaminyl-tRNA synthetase
MSGISMVNNDSEEVTSIRTSAYNTAKQVWKWSEEEALDLAENAVKLWTKDEPLKGRSLKEFYDVNPTKLLNEHKTRIGMQIRTRFPPEPNGYAHTGHAKSMYMNFQESFDRVAPELSHDNRHVTFRYDDTNPEVESQEYIDKLAQAVEWLGWKPSRTTFTSDYFPEMYKFALQLIDSGDAFVCHQTGEEIEQSRQLAQKRHEPGFDPTVPMASPESPWRNTTPAENRRKFFDMKRGLYAEGEASLRLKIDMFHPNPNMWDPVAYRVIYHSHPHTGDAWCIYPTYDYSHCIVDSLEDIDYSICTLEFETRRESYYWLLWKLNLYRPKVFEFARLELTRTVMSKRKLKKLVETKEVRGWDDPRMPTLMGMRRRGFSRDVINKFMKEIGVTRSMSVVDVNRFFAVVHHDLEENVPRCFGVLEPVPLELENVPADFSCLLSAPLYPQKKAECTEMRELVFSRICYVDRENVRADAASAGSDFYGLVPGKFVRLRYGPLVECKSVKVDKDGKVESLVGVCWFNEDSPHKHLNPSPQPEIKPKGILHWIAAPPGEEPLKFEARLYDHLLLEDGDTKNPTSEIIVTGALIERKFIENEFADMEEAKLQGRDIVKRFQMERVGFFCIDIVDCHSLKELVFNRILPLYVWTDASATSTGATSATVAEKGKSRKEERLAQEAAKAERLKYSCKDFFKRPGEGEKWDEFDETGFPLRAKGETQPLSKNAVKQLKKDLDKHKKDREAAGFSD